MPSLHMGEQIPLKKPDRNGKSVPAQGTRPSGTIPLRDSTVQVEEFIAEGGQGEVYRVRYQGKDYALKCYKKPAPPEAFYENLINNVERGAPGEHFIWPLAVMEKYKGSYGYLMELIPSRYRKFGDYLLGTARFQSYAVMIEAALNIVESFRLLHSGGYSYQDLNEGGFFINPKDGDVLICDNDNVAPFGSNLGVKGFPRYMAPEVVTNQSQPNTHSDRFSLAVLLFRLFYIDHPLEGKMTIRFPLTDAIGSRMFGTHPIFCYDPKNDRNRPDPAAHPNVIQRWGMYPPDLQVTATKAFTKGLLDINSRITEMEWEEALVKVRDMLVRPDGRERFINAYARQRIPEGCRFLKLPRNLVVLGDGSYLYSCHVNRHSADYRTVAGIVRTGLLSKTELKLENQSDTEWHTTSQSGKKITVVPKGSVRLAPGMRIDFGGTIGEVY